MERKSIALITGSTRGIGKEIALTFLKNGYFVILNSNNDVDKNNNVLEEFSEYLGSYDYYTFDVSKRDEVRELINVIISKYKKIDVLVNNAGITKDKSMVKLDDDMWDDVLNVNLTGVYNVCKQVVPNMIENKFGRVINISSVIALSGNFGQTNYAASKAGVIGFTKSLAQEVARYGVTINAVAPGFIETDMTKDLPIEVIEKLNKKIPIGAFGKPKDVANVVVFLAKNESSYITGETISVNGGLYLK